ncbi:MAG: M28 family peptidase [Actinomycetota bacterium]|nr:M28 family peptidase [Actinomycetota bacterium]
MAFALIFAFAALAVSGCGEDDPGEPTPQRFDEERAFLDLEAQVEIGPRPAGSDENAELVRLISARLRAAGAEDVRVQAPHRNVVATIPGSQAGTVVVGAHHDTKDIPGFAGANDGASGVAVVLELARVLGADAPLDGPSVSLALFDAEEARGDRPFSEDGTRGSRQYVALAEAGGRQGTPMLSEIEGMILFDLVGDCSLEIPRETGSDERLYALFADAAREVSGSDSSAPFEGETSAIGDDHVPFLGAGVPAVDLIDFTYGPGPRPGAYWHTTEDTLDKVCPESLDAVGEAAVRVIEGFAQG